MTNRERSYPPLITSTGLLLPGLISQQKLFPFNEWLYFKMYLHPAGFSGLLLNYIQPFISQNVRQGNISSWFFVSYYDDDFHLRVRLRQVPGREVHLLKTYKKLEKGLQQLPNLKKLELSTYFKESERYSLIGIECAEELFNLSSEMVLSELRRPILNGDLDNNKLFYAVRYVLMVSTSLGLGYKEMEDFAEGCIGHLAKEQKLAFDSEFRKHQRDLREFVVENKKQGTMEKKYMTKLLKVTRLLKPDEKLRLVADLNHMHLNRHYLHDQPFYETKTYYFLTKIARSLVNY